MSARSTVPPLQKPSGEHGAAGGNDARSEGASDRGDDDGAGSGDGGTKLPAIANSSEAEPLSVMAMRRSSLVNVNAGRATRRTVLPTFEGRRASLIWKEADDDMLKHLGST